MSCTLSVILPVYNGLPYLADAIESVLTQSFRDFELIIINDGSTEAVSQVIQNYQAKDSRIRFYQQENRGLGFTLNRLIEYARGELIARMDADDVCEPSRFEVQVDSFLSQPELVMVGGQIDFLVSSHHIKTRPMPHDHSEIVGELLLARFPICHPAVMFRRSAALKVGGYRLGGAGEDLDFFLRMSEVGRITNVSTKVLSYRIQQNSLSMRRQHDLNRGYAFAVYNAKQRRLESPEISIASFEADIWGKRRVVSKFSYYLHNQSERLYRRYFINLAHGSRMSAFLSLGIAAILRPRTSFRRLVNTVVRLIGGG